MLTRRTWGWGCMAPLPLERSLSTSPSLKPKPFSSDTSYNQNPSTRGNGARETSSEDSQSLDHVEEKPMLRQRFPISAC